MPYFFETIILNCLKQLNGERTIYSIYHLLKGKKSSQTIQDAHLFDLTKYFGVYQRITRETLEETIRHAFECKWISPVSEQRYIVTELGEEQLMHSRNQFSGLLYLNGWKYNQQDLKFWERLSLLIQVVSNLIKHETRYIPIQKDKNIHQWLKNFLIKNDRPRESLGSALFSELVECFEESHHLNPFVLVIRLTGFDRIGLTPFQAAEKLKMELSRYYLEFTNILHYLIQRTSSDSKRFPLLSSIHGNSEHNHILTKSAQQTYQILKQGLSIEETAKLRNLKTSTIEDHLVEITLNIDGFSIEEYVELQLQQKILATSRKTDSKQLKEIRSKITEANYFQIRLVLAKYGAK